MEGNEFVQLQLFPSPELLILNDMFLLLIGTVLAIVVIKHYLDYADHYKASRQIRGPITLPIIGNLLQLMCLSDTGMLIPFAPSPTS